MKKLVMAVLMAFFCSLGINAQITTTVKLDGRDTGRTFEGIGAISAGASSRLLTDYPEPYRSQILDYLFKPNYGASLQHLKVEIGGDTNSTDGSEPSHMRRRDDLNFDRGYEWWLMKEAKKRNPRIVLDSLAWGAPGWIGNGGYWSQDMADYVTQWIKGAKDKHGLEIDFTGTWNEVWKGDPKEHEWIKLLRKTLDAHGVKTKIVAPDGHASLKEKQWDFIKVLNEDPELKAAVYAIGFHYPFGDDETRAPEWGLESGYRLWSSEDSQKSNPAHRYNRNYIRGRMTKTEIWSPITSYYDNLAAPGSGLMKANSPWSGHYEVQASIWATAHTTQFAQPGWQYLDHACGYLPEKGTFASLKAPNSKDYSVIIESAEASKPQQMTFQIAGGLSTGRIHVWRTNSESSFQKLADIVPQRGSFTITIEPNSIYSLSTTTGQAKGAAVAPAPSPFPFPYAEDFSRYKIGATPKYLCDQDGVFEVVACKERDGKCLEQQIVSKPISWGMTPDPYTYAGNIEWSDYEVSTNVLLLHQGEASLLGRIESGDVFQGNKAHWPSAYILTVNNAGEWELNSAKYKRDTVKLASGKIAFDTAKWHTMRLVFKGTTIQAVVDGTVLSTITDSSHSRGMAGVGSGWNHVQFDNFSVR
ncbi:MAG TPA: family 16 glycoside hydrolase [Terriglobales bacterium]|nr:family 16 glycoside hydrolase [Terriglobales bacterium]